MNAQSPTGEGSLLQDSNEILSYRRAETLLQSVSELFRDRQYEQSLPILQQALAITQELSDRSLEAEVLYRLGSAYDRLGQYHTGLKFYQQALEVRQAIGDLAGAGSVLNSIGAIYHQQGNYTQAVELYQQTLTLRRQVGDRLGEARTLNNLGLVYNQRGQYARGLDFYQQALPIFHTLQNKSGMTALLNNIGITQTELGQYEQALQSHQQALRLRRENNDIAGEGVTLHNLGFVHNKLQQYEQAVSYYQQALKIRREIGNIAGEAVTLNNLGYAENELGKHSQALQSLQQALTLFRQLGDKAGEGHTLDSIGKVYKSQGNWEQGLEYYSQGLGIQQEIGDRPSQRITLSNIGDLLVADNQPELAIVFYKQSVNVTEAIRKDSANLSREQQQSYTETVATTYRKLGDLLLQQNRVTEAQQILDLLKVQELDDFLHNVRGNEQTFQGIQLLPIEERIWELSTTIPGSSFRQHADVSKLLQQLRQRGEIENFQIPNLSLVQAQLAEHNAVLFYPLVLEDRLELILVSSHTAPIRHTVPISQEELQKNILNLRQGITNRAKANLLSHLPPEKQRDDKVLIPAQQLYDWLIRPIENELIQSQAKTIIYAPDSQLRYIPLATLHDRNQWLVERFSINNITAAMLTNFKDSPPQSLRVLAGAFSQGNYQMSVGNLQFSFYGLDFADIEVQNIASRIPQTTQLLNQEFTHKTILEQLNQHNILHLATHGAFASGQPENSFILFGDGDRVTLRDLENWNLQNVDLVVLSACQTGIGEYLGNGQEILGLGYQMQQAGAAAIVASLWMVDDEGTQQLMDTFYAALQSHSSKAEALHKAQKAMIQSGKSHPYYWAPFIMIGNGLY